MTKPTFVIVPGALALPSKYTNLFEALGAKGYELTGVHYPSVGFRDSPHKEVLPTLHDDAVTVAEAVIRLADEGKDGHSYGGLPITEALKIKGVIKADRQKEGKKGGLVRLAYMTGIVAPVGSSATDILGDMPEENRVDFVTRPDGWVDWGDKPSIAALVLSDHANQSENLAYINATEIQSAVSFTSPLTYAGYKDVPVSYLLCEGDRIIIPRAQREGIELIEKESGRKVDVYTTQAGHCPNFTAMGEVVEYIKTLCGIVAVAAVLLILRAQHILQGTPRLGKETHVFDRKSMRGPSSAALNRGNDGNPSSGDDANLKAVCDGLRKELMDIEKQLQDDEKIQQALEMAKRCEYGYSYVRHGNGYRCAGGLHYIADVEVQAHLH
ncbi:uncharacterized protein GGS25DRAFT_528858 [Hypoxylon fragiforme]|uniref:uncharacterized protein n=1 Tax=Hypoxylon fragiforme TaxID=63214 RepID=UPI0020C70CEF|nr:uncharacterized protein GGS25DRAFT_528858 [Hypoxylon fragiforme]KAI2612155.1 hypothetical protein GGS25DRAFT_528858 [Hypoxylon fragiforme]